MSIDPRVYEALGSFYLGRRIAAQDPAQADDLLLYDSKDLTTHAVCVGMTGSGKTGLCVGLLEEAAIDSVPALVIDPKGDLTNLMLTFPQLRPQDFRPWINPDDARRKGLDPDGYAAQQADLWRQGLAEWGQDGTRIQRLRDAADFAIYTPGSDAGTPLSIVSSFNAPGQQVVADADLMRDQVSTATSGLLGLLGLDADPLRSRDHILLATLIDHAWRQGQDVDLAGLIRAIQSPPVSRLGVLDLDTFYPAKERFGLAMQLNNLLAAPGFSTWMQGEPLDVQSLLYTASGRPRVSIVYVAHLTEAERMFVVTLLLNRMLAWMRGRPGTTSLRALLYMDEIFGYIPPVAEPPSKRPLLTLLKQARAYGVGLLLATQNPVDLDYKGLSNCGTWFLGRLQTERDKERVLDGLEGAASSATGFDREAMDRTLSGLGKRSFLLHNVHDAAPCVFQTRWVMSYLRGPMTRNQIRTLGGSATEPEPAADVSDSGPVTTAASTPARTTAPGGGPDLASAPVLPPSVPVCYLPVTGAPGGSIVYQPRLLARVRLLYSDRRRGLETEETRTLLAAMPATGTTIEWETAVTATVDPAALLTAPPVPGSHAVLPAVAGEPKSYPAWNRSLVSWMYRNARVEVLKSSALKEYSRPPETEADFRIRLRQRAREERDDRVEKLRARYASKLRVARDRIRRGEQTVARESEQARGATMQTAISVGATLLAAVLGRQALSSTTLGKATTAARGAGRAVSQAQDIRRAKETLRAYTEQLEDLERRLRAEIDEIGATLDPAREHFETLALRPKKSEVEVRTLTLAWAPVPGGPHGPATRL